MFLRLIKETNRLPKRGYQKNDLSSLVFLNFSPKIAKFSPWFSDSSLVRDEKIVQTYQMDHRQAM